MPGGATYSTLRPEDAEAVRRFANWKHRRKTAVASDADADTPLSQAVYAELMRTAFGPALREAGLRGSTGRFELPSATHWGQLGFQKSAYSVLHDLLIRAVPWLHERVR